jgi:SAM-dependent methyltransferase
MNHDATYWQKRYLDGSTGWDLQLVSPPIKKYCDQLVDKSLRVLIPGAGFGHEAEYLVDNGFFSVTALDFASGACEALIDRIGSRKKHELNVVCGDFFTHEGQYDLILEQTMFCALHPNRRIEYIEKIYSLLSNGGKYVGLLFASHFEKEGPPFGGTYEEYIALFTPHFYSIQIEPCYNSIAPRAGNELWINMSKQQKI